MGHYDSEKSYYGMINNCVYEINVITDTYSSLICGPVPTKDRTSARKFRSLETFEKFVERTHRRRR
jgi:hypothetical protein